MRTHQDREWILKPQTESQAQCRLFCLPYAGGGASVFLDWQARLPQWMEVCAWQLPGREGRYREPAFVRAVDAADEVARKMEPWLDRPYALFGYSMGALLSFEVARSLRRRHQPMPMALLLAAYLAPHLPRRQAPVRDLPREQLLHRLREMNGTPAPVLRNRDLMDFLLPTIRADFEICETYRYEPEPPLDIPFLVVGGLQDPEVGAAQLEGWRQHTTAGFTREMLEGDHFFLQKSREALFARITDSLQMGVARPAGMS